MHLDRDSPFVLEPKRQFFGLFTSAGLEVPYTLQVVAVHGLYSTNSVALEAIGALAGEASLAAVFHADAVAKELHEKSHQCRKCASLAGRGRSPVLATVAVLVKDTEREEEKRRATKKAMN